MVKQKTNRGIMIVVLIIGIMAFLLSQMILGNIINGVSVLIENISSIIISVVISYLVVSELNKNK